jgi:hypothetical protein
MARKTAAMEPPKARETVPSGVPPQSTEIDVWPILADPAKAIEEIAAGQHDGHIRFIEHVCRSQSLADVLAACWSRIEVLEK